MPVQQSPPSNRRFNSAKKKQDNLNKMGKTWLPFGRISYPQEQQERATAMFILKKETCAPHSKENCKTWPTQHQTPNMTFVPLFQVISKMSFRIFRTVRHSALCITSLDYPPWYHGCILPGKAPVLTSWAPSLFVAWFATISYPPRRTTKPHTGCTKIPLWIHLL